MGLYDTLGKTQVKCFYEANIYPMISEEYRKRVDSEDEDDKFEMTYSHGNLKTYKPFSTVPWMTLYYNYGPQFMIFDPSNVEGTELVHIVAIGRYLRSVKWNELNTFMHPIRLVIDKTGTPLKITKKEDFGTILKQYKYYDGLYREKVKDYYKTTEILPSRTIQDMIDLQDQVFAPYDERWVDQKSTVHDKTLIGAFLAIIGDFLQVTSDEILKKVTQQFSDYVGGRRRLDAQIASYLIWATTHKIPIRVDTLEKFFEHPSIENYQKLAQQFPKFPH